MAEIIVLLIVCALIATAATAVVKEAKSPFRSGGSPAAPGTAGGERSGRHESRSGGAPVAPAPGATGARPWQFWRRDRSTPGTATLTRPERPAPPVEPSPLPHPTQMPDRSTGARRPEPPTGTHGRAPVGARRPPVAEPPGEQTAPRQDPLRIDLGPRVPTQPEAPRITAPPAVPQPPTITTRSWRDDRTDPQLTAQQPAALNPGGTVSGELAPTAGTGEVVTPAGPGHQLEAATLTTANARQYYDAIAISVEAMRVQLQDLSEVDRRAVEQYRTAAAGLRTIAIKLDASIAAMKSETLDPSIIGEAISHRANVQQMAKHADAVADGLEKAIKADRIKLREFGLTVASGARRVRDLLMGYKRAEEAVQTTPLQMPDHTRVLGRQ